MPRRLTLITLALAACLAGPSSARAHGIWGHVHVTGWAVENLPPGDLRDFFADPEVMNAALFGAVFTDSGYSLQNGSMVAASRAYSEHTHWEPFIQDFVEWVLVNDPPPWVTSESRRRIGFLMGCAAHGMQDEIFDSLFLFQTQEKDGGGQEEADPGTDGFLALDGHLRFMPQRDVPMDTVLELYEVLDEEVTEEVIDAAVSFVTFIYAGPAGPDIALGLGEEYAPIIPWSRDHYLDPFIPGSLKSEIGPTMGYMQAIWDRLHGTFDPADAIVWAYPDPPRRLLATGASTPDTWMTFVSGIGMKPTVAQGALVDAEGAPVDHKVQGTRWGGLGSFGRILRIQPTVPLDPGAWYTATAAAGIALIDGSTLTVDRSLTAQAPCDEATADACPDLGDLPGFPTEPPAVVEEEPDAGPDAAEDADGGPDAEDADAGPEPDGSDDAAPPADTAEAPDTAAPDAVAEPPGAVRAGGGGGCAGGGPEAPLGALAAGLVAAWVARRRRVAAAAGGAGRAAA